MRLFTAFDVPSDQRPAFARVEDLAADAPFSARWSPPAQYHCTLRFLGDTDRETAQSYRSALHEIDAPPFECEPYGLDVLPDRRTPRVLIAGLRLSPSLKQLYQQVSEVLEERGLEPEARDYRPHVTLARFDDADPRAVHDFLRSHADVSFPSFSVTAFHLFESTRTQDGSIHEVRETVPLLAESDRGKS